MQIVTTERLILRPILPEDSQSVYRYRSDKVTNKFQNWIPGIPEEVDNFIQNNPKHFNQPNTWFQLVIIIKDSRELIGDIGIHFTGTTKAEIELGCTLAKDFQGNGFAHEALTGVLELCFTGLKKQKATAYIDPENHHSLKLFTSLGFKKTKHIKNSIFLRGEWRDDIELSLINPAILTPPQ